MLKRWKIAGIAVFALAAALPAAEGAALANSAQRYWTGSTSTGALVTGEQCPVTVEKETLTFRISDFPDDYYEETDAALAYDAQVTARYELYNPADYTVELGLAFPFGELPDYLCDLAYLEGFDDTARYQVTANGESVERRVRHTYQSDTRTFDTERELARLADERRTDAFFRPDTPVSVYTFSFEVSTESASAPVCASAELSYDADKTKILLDTNGFERLNASVRLTMWTEAKGNVVLYAVGDPVDDRLPTWRFYRDGSKREPLAGGAALRSVTRTTLAELVDGRRGENSSVSETDWYNASVDFLREQTERNQSCYLGQSRSLDLTGHLLRWYEYTLTLAPGERLVNEVTAPLYPDINGNYRPSAYRYRYLLSPARMWASFGNLNVRIETPFYLTESRLSGFARTETGYEATFSGLPDGELELTLCAVEHPQALTFPRGWSAYTVALVVGLSLAGVLALVCILLFVRERRKSRARPKG